jgi:hypothetical protein
MDFEDSVVHDGEWLKAQPKGTVGVMLQEKSGNGPDKWELAVGKGRNGGNAVRVFSPDATWREPDVFISKMQSTGSGGLVNLKDETGFLNTAGKRANRLSFWIKFENEDWIKQVAALQPARYPNHQNLHVGTYQFDRDLIGSGMPVKESDNWHFYHQIWIRPDKAGDNWINVVVNELPNHQRNVKGNPSLNPTAHSGPYWELLTRFYIEPIFLRKGGDSVQYPYGFYLDDIELLQVEESKSVEISFMTGPKGTKLAAFRGSEQTQEFQVRNRSSSKICGGMRATGNPSLNPEILQIDKVSKVGSLCLEPFANKQLHLRILAAETLKFGKVYDSGVIFIPDNLPGATDTAGSVSLSDPNVEQRWVPEVGGTDVPLYGSYLRFSIN